MEIEFTDRYGGRAPSWLRACHGQCEAMGVVPVFRHVREPNPGECVPIDNEADHALNRAWDIAHAQPHEEPCDGWHFVGCPECRGTGRVSTVRAIFRVPRWLGKGTRFAWQAHRTEGWRAPWMSQISYTWLIIKIAYLKDLGLARI